MKKILLFTDLEGTLLDEQTDSYRDEEMYAFISSIDKLQNATGFTVDLHIVSPMSANAMEKVINKIDNAIFRYNLLHLHKENFLHVLSVQGGTISPETIDEDYYDIDERLMKMPTGVLGTTDISYGKSHYVKIWTDALMKEDQLGAVIYCGNGGNDLAAMKDVSEMKNGFTVCPSNSKAEIKKIASFTSPFQYLKGVTDGLNFIAEKFKQEKQSGESEENIENSLEKK